MMDDIRKDLNNELSKLTDICDITADGLRCELGSVDDRLIGLGSEVSNQGDALGVMTADVVINADELKHIKTMGETLKENINNKNDESLSSALSDTGDKFSTLEIGLGVLKHGLTVLGGRVNRIVNANIRSAFNRSMLDES